MKRLLDRVRGERPDEGVSLIEVLTSMVIMSIFMAMFFGGIMTVFQSSYHAESAAVAQAQVNTAYLRLDKEIRYAAGISTEGTMGANPVVEYLTTSYGAATCTQLRLDVDSQQLQWRSWPQGVDPLLPSQWIPLATEVTSAKPFTFLAADATYNFERLKLDITSTNGDGTGMASRTTTLTFTALNTTLGTASDAVCTEGRSVP
jgi:prepilin-type N-terminal cleavage/methylation domain-containing protein